LEPHFKTLREEFSAFEVEIAEKRKRPQQILLRLLKSSSIYDLQVTGQATMKIKFEVDTDPPLGFGHRRKAVDPTIRFM
jgi:hypothetical protein